MNADLRALLPESVASRLILLLALAMPFLGIWAFPLFDLDEGAFTASTTEMFLRGDFLSTWLNGAPRYDKPVLSYWLQAVSASLLGFNEIGFRLPSALAASTWIFLVYAHSARLAGREAGLLAAVILAGSLGPLVIAKAATADALLNLALAGAGYAAWLWLETRAPRWLYLSWAAMAVGFLTKGPVAAIVPGGAVFLFCLLARDWPALRAFFLNGRAWALFLAICVPWFVLLTLREGPGFLTGFFLKHNLGRFATPMESHRGSPFYYLPVLLISLLPFSGLLFTLSARAREAWRLPGLRFGLLWFLLVFALFSASGTKLPHYLYYGYSGLIPVLAWSAGQARRSVPILLVGVATFALLLFLPDILHTQVGRVNPDYAAALASLDNQFGATYRIFFATALILSLASIFARGISLSAKLSVLGLATGLCLSLLLLPAVGNLIQAPVKAAALAARPLSGPLVMYAMNQPSFQTYVGRRVERRQPRSGDLVVTPVRHLAELPPHDRVGEFSDIALARVR